MRRRARSNPLPRALRALAAALAMFAVSAAPAAAADDHGYLDTVIPPGDDLGALQELEADPVTGDLYTLDNALPVGPAFDECGDTVTPLRLQRWSPEGALLATRVLDTRGPFQPRDIAVSGDADPDQGRVYLAAPYAAPDLNGNGACDVPDDYTSPTLLAFRRDTLAPASGSATAVDMSISAVERVAVATGTQAGAADDRLFVSGTDLLEGNQRLVALDDAGTPRWSRQVYQLLPTPDCGGVQNIGDLAGGPGHDAWVLTMACDGYGDDGSGLVRVDGLDGATGEYVLRTTQNEHPFAAWRTVDRGPDGSIFLAHREPTERYGQVVARGNGIVQYDAQYRYVRAWGFSGPTSDGPCRFPRDPDVAVAPDGRVYTGDRQTDWWFNPEPARVERYGPGGVQPGCIRQPLPVPRITVTPEHPSPGEEAVLDGTASSDPNDEIVHYAWDVDADGEIDVEGPDATVVHHAFPVPGVTTVTLRVRDSFGDEAELTQDVRVRSPVPAPQLTWTPAQPRVGQVVTFDGSQTASAVRFEWDLDGDGEYEVDSGALTTVEHRYAHAGVVHVGLRATNTDGVVGETRAALEVAPPGPAPPPEPPPPPALIPGDGGAGPLGGIVAGDTEAPRVRLAPARRLDARGVLRVTVRCPAAERDCGGELRVVRKGRRGALARRSFHLPGGQRTQVPLALGRAARKRGVLRVTLVARASDAAGNTAQVRRQLRLRAGKVGAR